MNFQDIVKQLDTAISEHPELTVDQAIELKLTEMGIAEETRKRVAEACGLIDSYEKEYENLQTAKAHGISRRSWLEHRIDKLTEEFPEQEKSVILAAIAKQLQKIKSWITNS